MALCLAVLLAALWLLAVAAPMPGLTKLYLVQQDTPVIAGLIGLLIAAAAAPAAPTAAALPNIHLNKRTVLGIAASLTVLLWAGTYLLLANYPLTRDEHMVVFDAGVFGAGQLAFPLAPIWRPYAEALTPAFLLPLPGNVAWVSAYMPGNALLRTVFGAVADPALMNPLLAAVGGVITFGTARRLFPDSASSATIALLLYVTSAQVLVTAMTTYAMTAHLAFNMIWLWLYLRGTRPAHAGAIAIGFVAIGLHQVAFHPLFALPFIDRLRRNGEWRTAVIYLACYAAFVLFWTYYPHLVALAAGATHAAGAASGSAGFIAQRVLPLLLNRDPLTLPLTAANLIRFVSWQNLAMLPLLLLSWGAISRNDGIARPLATGILLTVAAMTILLPYQGHGWGYRYLHGLVGSCALLAAYGWRDFSKRPEVRIWVAIGSLTTILGSVPFLASKAYGFAQPYARVSRMIDRIDADMVVIETEGTSFAVDVVRNRPDLSNRPIRLAGKDLAPKDMLTLCARGTVAFVDVSQMQKLGLGVILHESSSRHFKALQQAAQGHCRSAM